MGDVASLPDYKIGERLGSGAFGSVYKVSTFRWSWESSWVASERKPYSGCKAHRREAPVRTDSHVSHRHSTGPLVRSITRDLVEEELKAACFAGETVAIKQVGPEVGRLRWTPALTPRRLRLGSATYQSLSFQTSWSVCSWASRTTRRSSLARDFDVYLAQSEIDLLKNLHRGFLFPDLSCRL